MFVKYETADYPYALESNPLLYDIVRGNPTGPVHNTSHKDYSGGWMTDIFLHQKEIKEVDNLVGWIYKILPSITHKFTGSNTLYNTQNYTTNLGGGGEYNIDMTKLNIPECWGILYNKGEGVRKHNHVPYFLSFAYCVNAPKGSSPLIIEGERILPVAGRVIFFLSHQFHSVPPNKYGGRCSIVGNISYVP